MIDAEAFSCDDKLMEGAPSTQSSKPYNAPFPLGFLMCAGAEAPEEVVFIHHERPWGIFLGRPYPCLQTVPGLSGAGDLWARAWDSGEFPCSNGHCGLWDFQPSLASRYASGKHHVYFLYFF